MSKSSQELKALIYYNIRRGWYSQASQICESIPNKGRDPFSLYWQAITQGKNIFISLLLFHLLTKSFFFYSFPW